MRDNDISKENELNEFQRESLSRLVDKTDIEKLMSSSNFKYNEEKSKHLGFMRENIIYEYKKDVLYKPEIYKKVAEDMSNPKVEKVIINGNLIPEIIMRIIEEAQEQRLSFTIIKDPNFIGEIGLVLSKKN